MEHGIDYPRAKQIFLESLEISDPQQAEDFVRRQCGQANRLQAEVERLRSAHLSADAWLDAADNQLAAEHLSPLAAGQQLDRYLIEDLIGEGGMGLVYRAQQQSPVQRVVAIKVIKPGLDTREVLARFRFEQQALAQLDHPYIAKVYDAGSTPDGYPYFVMELVNGIAITDFCLHAQMDLEARLRVFQEVCAAVGHAHQRGIIHRDLKPSNILACRDGSSARLKVIDFGVAKLVDGRSSARTRFTRLPGMLGTPDYMSPEQQGAEAHKLDTRSDVYSLGVILYELLTGHLPHENAALDTERDRSQKTVFDQPSRLVKPSQRAHHCTQTTCGSAKREQGCHCRVVGRALRGDLDWIVLKALDEEKSRRYQSVTALADDIDRFLRGEAIVARPPSIGYRLRKSAWQHRIALIVASTMVLAALTVAIVSWRTAKVTAKSERRALAMQRSAKRAELDAQALLYASDMRIAAKALEEGDASEAAALLRRHDPRWQSGAFPRDDLRGLEWYFLNRQVAGSQTLLRLASPLVAVDQHVTSGWIATVGNDSQLHFLAPESGRITRTLDTGISDVACMTCDPASGYVALASTEGLVSIWDPGTGKCVAKRKLTSGPIHDLQFALGGRQLVVANHSPHLEVIDTKSGELVHRIDTDHQDVSSLSLSRDGTRLVCGSADQRSSLWDLQQRKRLLASSATRYRTTCVAMDPLGRFWVDANVKGKVRVLDAGTAEVLYQVGLPSAVQTLAVSPSGQEIAVGCRSGVIHVLAQRAPHWSADSQVERSSFSVHGQRVTGITWLADSRIASVAKDGSLACTSYQLRRPTRVRPGSKVQKLSVSPSGKWIALHDYDHVFLVDVTSGFIERIDALETESHWAGMTFTRDEACLLVASADGLLVSLSLADRSSATKHSVAPGIDIAELRFSRNGERLLLFSRRDDLALVVDYPTLNRRFECACPDAYTGALSPDGSYLATNYQWDVLLYDVDHGIRIAESKGHHSETINDLQFSPDGRWIASASDDRTLRIWDPSQSAGPQLVGIHPDGVPRAVSVSSDGRTLFTSSVRGQLWAWSVASRQKLLPVATSAVGFPASKLAANDSILATLDRDGSVEWYEMR